MKDIISKRKIFLPIIFALGDYLGIVLAEHISFILRDCLDFWNHVRYLYSDSYIYVWIPALYLIFIAPRTYDSAQPIVDILRSLFKAIFFGWMASIILIYFLKASEQASRLFIILFGIFSLIDVCLIRYMILKFIKRRKFFYEPVLLIGAGKTAECMLRFWENDVGYRYEIIGIVDDHPISTTLPKEFKILGGFSEAKKLVRRTKIETVIIAAPGLSKDHLQDLIVAIQPYVKNISFVPDLIGTPMADADLRILFSEKILMLNLRNNLSRWYNRLIKRLFDLFFTITGGILISPILLILAIIVAIDNRGRVIFAHRRVGRNGREFSCYKFQTMIPNAQEVLKEYLEKNPEARQEWEESFKLTNDPRVTKLGNFLRRTSLDELPQLWNVICGDMSLVGPRPIVKAEIPRYQKNIREYFMVLPGITGMWQVSGRSDTTYEERVAMDTWYVRNWSVWIDLMYLFKTVKAVLQSRGAY